MRVKPSALTAILAIVGYLVVVFTVWAITGLKYDEVGDTVDNVRKGVILAIGLGAVYLVVVTTALGWWKPAIREPRRVGGGWMWAIPVLLLVGAVVNLAATKWGEIDGVGTYVFWLALGCAFVGFSEELLTRGLAIVGGRGSMHEKWVWVFSGVIFGLLAHAQRLLRPERGQHRKPDGVRLRRRHDLLRHPAHLRHPDRHHGAARDVGLLDLHPGPLGRSTSIRSPSRSVASSSTWRSSSASSPW